MRRISVETSNYLKGLQKSSPDSSHRARFSSVTMKVEDRLDNVPRELTEMRTQLYSRKIPRVIKLKGLLKGHNVDPSDVVEARKSFFKQASS